MNKILTVLALGIVALIVYAIFFTRDRLPVAPCHIYVNFSDGKGFSIRRDYYDIAPILATSEPFPIYCPYRGQRALHMVLDREKVLVGDKVFGLVVRNAQDLALNKTIADQITYMQIFGRLAAPELSELAAGYRKVEYVSYFSPTPADLDAVARLWPSASILDIRCDYFPISDFSVIGKMKSLSVLSVTGGMASFDPVALQYAPSLRSLRMDVRPGFDYSHLGKLPLSELSVRMIGKSETPFSFLDTVFTMKSLKVLNLMGDFGVSKFYKFDMPELRELRFGNLFRSRDETTRLLTMLSDGSGINLRVIETDLEVPDKEALQLLAKFPELRLLKMAGKYFRDSYAVAKEDPAISELAGITTKTAGLKQRDGYYRFNYSDSQLVFAYTSYPKNKFVRNDGVLGVDPGNLVAEGLLEEAELCPFSDALLLPLPSSRAQWKDVLGYPWLKGLVIPETDEGSLEHSLSFLPSNSTVTSVLLSRCPTANGIERLAGLRALTDARMGTYPSDFAHLFKERSLRSFGWMAWPPEQTPLGVDVTNKQFESLSVEFLDPELQAVQWFTGFNLTEIRIVYAKKYTIGPLCAASQFPNLEKLTVEFRRGAKPDLVGGITRMPRLRELMVFVSPSIIQAGGEGLAEAEKVVAALVAQAPNLAVLRTNLSLASARNIAQARLSFVGPVDLPDPASLSSLSEMLAPNPVITTPAIDRKVIEEAPAASRRFDAEIITQGGVVWNGVTPSSLFSTVIVWGDDETNSTIARDGLPTFVPLLYAWRGTNIIGTPSYRQDYFERNYRSYPPDFTWFGPVSGKEPAQPVPPVRSIAPQ
ncbi:MAG: hypothetical protein WC712_12255 [Candidatus Brocadiia bacterium]